MERILLRHTRVDPSITAMDHAHARVTSTPTSRSLSGLVSYWMQYGYEFLPLRRIFGFLQSCSSFL
jgi:hypothetical protein